MAEHWNGGSGGKGSKPRPYNISKDEFDDKFTTIFGEKKKYCSKCGKTFSWCQCEDNTGVTKNEYQDILSTEECLDGDEKLTRYNSETQQVLGVKKYTTEI